MAEYFDIRAEAKEKKVFRVAGFAFPASSLITQESVEKALTLRLQPLDVVLSSYPRCDSKSIDSIVWKLLYTDLQHPAVNKIYDRFIPCIEMQTIDDLSCAYDFMIRHKLPRLYKTYLPYKLLPFYKRAKYIYVIRSPWELCTSYYKFLLLMNSTTDSFDVFFRNFLSGNVAYGSYFKHIIPWNKRISESNILILCHEHVEHNPRSAMYAVAAFLGDHYLTKLINNTELERSILKATDSEKCDEDDKRGRPKCCLEELHPLLGDADELNYQNESFKLTCTEMQLKEITDKVSNYFKDSSIEYLWLNLLKKQTPILFT